MKILFSSYTFAPNVGGIESASAILAERFAEAGHEVELVTETEGNVQHPIRQRTDPPWRTSNSESFREQAVQRPTYGVTRRPSLMQLFGLLRWCDLVFQNNISLRSLIPALLMRKRVIVVHQTWLRKQGGTLSKAPHGGLETAVPRGSIGWNNRIKRKLLPFVTNVAISEAVRDDLCRATASVAEAGGEPALQSQTPIIGNPYDDETFRLIANVTRDKMLVFVGRLVSDKGVDLLLEALQILQSSEENAQRSTPNIQRSMAEEGTSKHRDVLRPNLTIVGSGPEEEKLRRLVLELGLGQQVTFTGPKCGDELARLLNEHRVLVVPSLWAEPFGIVALEGIACGCLVVGSRGGGLPEAIGPCGLTFENGNTRELANCLKELLLNPEMLTTLQRDAAPHLIKFKVDTIAGSYLGLINEIAH